MEFTLKGAQIRGSCLEKGLKVQRIISFITMKECMIRTFYGETIYIEN